jgi:hypothetical protein
MESGKCAQTLIIVTPKITSPHTFDVISVFGSQQEARNIEKGFTPGHKNVHFLREQSDQYGVEPSAKYKNIIVVEGEFKKVPLVL